MLTAPVNPREDRRGRDYISNVSTRRVKIERRFPHNQIPRTNCVSCLTRDVIGECSICCIIYKCDGKVVFQGTFPTSKTSEKSNGNKRMAISRKLKNKIVTTGI